MSSVQAPAASVIGTSVDSMQVSTQRWKLTSAEPFRGKQDDVFFINAQIGWYGNGSGKIYGTRDGGASWKLLFDQPGTFFRTLALIDELHGFAGNVGDIVRASFINHGTQRALALPRHFTPLAD